MNFKISMDLTGGQHKIQVDLNSMSWNDHEFFGKFNFIFQVRRIFELLEVYHVHVVSF